MPEQGADVGVGPAELVSQDGRLGAAWRVVVDVPGVRLVGAEPGPSAPVPAGGAHLPWLDEGPLEVGVQVGRSHAWLAPPPADLEPLPL